MSESSALVFGDRPADQTDSGISEAYTKQNAEQLNFSDDSRHKSTRSGRSASKVIILAGPGRLCSKKELDAYYKAFKSRGTEVRLYGDGASDLSLGYLNRFYRDFVEPSDDVLVVIASRTHSTEDQHRITCQIYNGTPTKDVFTALAQGGEASGTRDVFFLGKDSYGALDHTDTLPEGSKVATLAAGEREYSPYIVHGDFARAVSTGAGPMTSDHLLDLYLTEIKHPRDDTTIATHTSGGERHEISKSLKNRLSTGSGYYDGQTNLILNRWGPRFGSDKCESLLSEIASGSRIEEEDMGLCLAFEKTVGGSEQPWVE